MRLPPRRHLLPVLTLAVLLGAGATLGTGRAAPPVAVAAAQEPPGVADEQYTPIIQSVHATPRWFPGADERVHLVYELLLTNAVSLPTTVTTVEVLDGAGGPAIATLTGADLTATMSLLTSPSEPAATLPPSTVGVVWFDLPFARQEQLPATIAHRVTVTVMSPPGAPPLAAITDVGGRATVDRRPPVVLGPPLLGSHWVAAGSCCDGPHRRGLFPINGRLSLGQRFAIDFNLLDDQGRIAATPLSVNTNHAGFGQPVLAVADATVVTAVDRYPDQIEGDHYPTTLENIPGNHVILDLGEGRFAFYAHLKHGSVAVRAGERVQRGQHIGELGNSGNSGGAHLHFHVGDRPSALGADGLPYAFDAFDLTGHAPPLAELQARYEAGQPLPIDTRGAGPRRDALPLGGDEIAFPREAGAAPSRPETVPAPSASGDIAGLVDIGGGRRLYLACRGQGSPTVVLEAGYRSPATVWTDDLVQPDMPRTMVFEGVAAVTRVCFYERPGVTSIIDGAFVPSRSDPVPQPRSVESVVADLRALLRAAQVPGPYVLATHSFGGLLARLYAATYPDEVVGLVLVDVWNEELERFVTPAQWTAILRLNAQVPPELAGVADYETIDFGSGSAVMRRAAAARPLPPLPLAVLARAQPLGIGDVDPEISDAVFEAAWRSAQEQLATLAPRARFFVATESAHYIQLQQPALVTEAIRQVVTGVRDPDAWNDFVSCCRP